MLIVNVHTKALGGCPPYCFVLYFVVYAVLYCYCCSLSVLLLLLLILMLFRFYFCHRYYLYCCVFFFVVVLHIHRKHRFCDVAFSSFRNFVVFVVFFMPQWL